MEGNSAKKAPVLDHLVSTNNAPKGQSVGQSVAKPPSPISAQPLRSAGQANSQATSQPTGQQPSKPAQAAQQQNQQEATPEVPTAQNAAMPQNRRTDKSQFEIELANTVNKIMMKHFEHASEQIVQQVLSEVRARLPGQRKG